jgi:capsular polysaccharide biosynthesis protein
MELSKFVHILRRYLWIFILAALVASLTTYFTLQSKPAVYEARTRLLVGPGLDSPSPDLNSLRIGGQLVQTYAELIISRPFLESVNDKLIDKLNPEALAGMIETRQNPDTRILTILVRHRDPNQAVAIANAAAQTLIASSPAVENTTTLLRTQMSNQVTQLEQIISGSQTAMQELEAKLIALGNASSPSVEAAQVNLEQQSLITQQLAEERARLSDALKTLATIYTVLRDTNTNQLEIIEPAGAVFPVDQNLPLRVAASGLAGLILAASIIFLSEHYDDAIRFTRDFTRAAKVPALGTVEKHKRLAGSGLERIITLARPDSPGANNYRMMAAKLLFSISKSMPYTFMLSSVGARSGEETAEIVANLGVAFAQAGKRVVLVDAQFHNPVLTGLFESSDKTGLAEYIGAGSPKLKLIPVKNLQGVQFLPAGISLEKSSGARLNSDKVTSLVEELQKASDIVLFAGAPISWFAESLTLATQVKGVILVARPGEARTKMVSEVTESLRDMHINLVGVIFDNNQPPFNFNPKLRDVYKSAPVASEDSPV